MTQDTANEVERMVVTRVFDAPRELVWKAWTEPKYVMQWWGPKDFTAPVCKMDFRVGGKSLCCMKSPDGQEFWNAIEYIESAYDVTLFEDLGNGQTKLTFIGNEPMADARESGQLEGWKQILDKFAEV